MEVSIFICLVVDVNGVHCSVGTYLNIFLHPHILGSISASKCPLRVSGETPDMGVSPSATQRLVSDISLHFPIPVLMTTFSETSFQRSLLLSLKGAAPSLLSSSFLFALLLISRIT